MIISKKQPVFALEKTHKVFLIAMIIWLITLQLTLLLYKIGDENVHLYFLDVGQGDCIVISDNTHCYIIDGGGIRNKAEKENTGIQILYPFLLEKGIYTVDAVFVTHLHYDHIKGILELLEVMNIKEVVLPSTYVDYFADTVINDFVETLFQGGDEGRLYEELVETCKKRSIPINFMSYGDNIHTNNMDIQCIYPKLDSLTDENENNNSLVLEFEILGFRALFTGDIEADTEEKIGRYWGNEEDINVLKVAHHGSKSSSSREFVQSLHLDCAIICVGDNLFGHPHETVLARFEEMNIPVYSTQKYGMIEIIIEEDGYTLLPFKGEL